MTQKELIDVVLSELTTIKKGLPNGELKAIQRDVESMKEDMSDMKYTLLNPENGVIVNTNKNTEFRQSVEAKAEHNAKLIRDLEEIKTWKTGVNRALWIIFGIIAAIVIRMLMMHKGL